MRKSLCYIKWIFQLVTVLDEIEVESNRSDSSMGAISISRALEELAEFG